MVPCSSVSVRAYRNRKKKNEQQPRMLMQWEHSYHVRRCGDVFVATPNV
jgi:hypothetical protein